MDRADDNSNISTYSDESGVEWVAELALLIKNVGLLQQEVVAIDAKAHLAAIVESSDDAIVSKSLDGTILSWNRAAELIFGYTACEIIGKPVFVLIPPERQDEEKQILSRLQQGERIEHFNTVRLTRDGSRLDVMVSISPVKDGNGRIVGASKILRTLTEQKKSERAIRNSEARLRGVVESAADGILTISEQGITESINTSGLKTFGYTADQLAGRDVRLLLPDIQLPDSSRAIGLSREEIGRRSDGALFPVDLSVSEVQLDDRKIFTAIVRDITSRKEAEKALLLAKDAAEAASLAKEHFLSVLSHELRTPLSPVLAEISSLQERADLPEELRSSLALIRRNVETESRLVDDLLDTTRISKGKVELHFEVVDLHEAVRTAVGMLQSSMETKSLEVSVALRASLHHVWADPGRFQQILLNLLSNAIKFTDQNGRIAIQSRSNAPAAVELEVSDSGIGMEPQLIERLFNAFEQSNTSRRLGGLGLGLSIAKSLAEMHGGTLSARSHGIGRGSTFCLTIPTAAPLEKAITPAVSTVDQATDLRVLLVEDHQDTRLVMTRLLKKLGCRVTSTGTVQEALAAAEVDAFDLLISDIGLPDGSGLEIMRQLRDRITRGIALSGYGQEEDLRKSREAGFSQHLVKPVNFGLLKEMVRRAG